MTTLSEVYDDQHLNLNHIIPLDFDSIRSLPDSHIWLRSDDDFKPSGDPFSIPLVDLMDPDSASLIVHACETWGMFQLTNHGIPLDLLDKVEYEARRLFSLPTTHKLKVLRSPAEATGYGLARISQFFNRYLWHEGFTIMGSSVNHARKLWPHDYHRFCDVMEDYEKKMKNLAIILTRQILKSLDIPEQKMSWVNGRGDNIALQLNSYPLCPEPDRAMGLAPHTDTSILTILHQSSTRGLQVFKQGVGWVSVCPNPGVLVVNVGDLLHILSNAKFPSALHRAIIEEPRHRLSVAFFYSSAPDFCLSPLPLSCGEIPVYRSLTVREYIGLKAKNFEKALCLIRNEKEKKL